MFETSLTTDAVLRPLEPWRATEFLANLDRCRDHISPWVGASFVAADLDRARAVLRRYADGQAADTKRIFGIWRNGTLVGGTMFVSFDAEQGVCEIGCWLEPAAQGNGFITKAVTLLLDWAFGERGLTRAEWRTLGNNEPSIKVAHRLGMRLDGTLRAAVPDGDTRRDEQIYSILAGEWRDRRSDLKPTQ